jgi:hypothetical protein
LLICPSIRVPENSVRESSVITLKIMDESVFSELIISLRNELPSWSLFSYLVRYLVPFLASQLETYLVDQFGKLSVTWLLSQLVG